MAIRTGDTISALAKGLRVLEAFDADHPRQSIAEVAERTGLDRATTRRCLLTFVAEGHMEHDGKFFTLTHRALRLGLSALAALPLPQIVQPWLDQLTEQIEQSCSVSILDGTDIVYLARAAQRRVMSIGLMPGSRLPAHCTSMGRVLLAALPPEAARGVLDASDLTPRSPYSLTDPDAIMARIDQARTDGYAAVDQEVETGLRALAVPLVSARGQVVAALNTGMAATQAEMATVIETCLPALRRTQAGLARAL